MSRDITGSPSTLEEAVYLMDRGRLPANLQRVVRGKNSREAAINALTDEFDEDAADDLSDDYSDWTNDQLRAELSERNLSTEGKKADLVERLEEDDAAAFDDEGEE